MQVVTNSHLYAVTYPVSLHIFYACSCNIPKYRSYSCWFSLYFYIETVALFALFDQSFVFLNSSYICNNALFAIFFVLLWYHHRCHNYEFCSFLWLLGHYPVIEEGISEIVNSTISAAMATSHCLV